MPEAQNHYVAMVLLRKNLVKGLDYYSRAIFGQVWPRMPPPSGIKAETTHKQELSLHFDTTGNGGITPREVVKIILYDSNKCLFRSHNPGMPGLKQIHIARRHH